METQLLHEGELRVFAVVFGTGEEVADGLLEFAKVHGVTGAGLTAIGAFERSTLAFFDIETKQYEQLPFDEQAEVLAFTGNLGTHEGAPKLHAHVVLGLRDGTTRGGHLLRAVVRPTLEVVVTETPAHLRRRLDDATGLPLIAPG